MPSITTFKKDHERVDRARGDRIVAGAWSCQGSGREKEALQLMQHEDTTVNLQLSDGFSERASSRSLSLS